MLQPECHGHGLGARDRLYAGGMGLIGRGIPEEEATVYGEDFECRDIIISAVVVTSR